MKLDKQNDQALNSLIDSSLYILLAYFLHVTFTCDFYLSDFTTKIICFNTFPKFLIFIYVTFKLEIFSNHAEYSKVLAPYYTLASFTCTILLN